LRAPHGGKVDRPKAGEPSNWSDVVETGPDATQGISCYFNRGTVASQWLSRLLPDAHPGTALEKIIATPGDTIRNFLGGPVRDKLVELLTHSRAEYKENEEFGWWRNRRRANPTGGL
jgi:hypothetical protein